MPEPTLASILSELSRTTGESFEPVDFSHRLRIQKSIYLLKALGYKPASRYSFGSFVRGPYSPDLTKGYYAIPRGTIRKAPPASIPNEQVKVVAEAIRRGNEFLETAASLHIYASRNPRTQKSALFEQLLWAKPRLRGHLEEAWRFLAAHRLLPAHT
jgi:uncharacterized protein YwgA